MSKCSLCIEFDDCPFASHDECDCSAFEQKTMTNSDVIRNMEDDDLAENIAALVGRSWDPDEVAFWKAWLKKDACTFKQTAVYLKADDVLELLSRPVTMSMCMNRDEAIFRTKERQNIVGLIRTMANVEEEENNG